MEEQREPDAERVEPHESAGPEGPDGPGEADAPEPEAPPRRRRYPSTIGGGFYLLILAAVGVGLWITWDSSDWRLGVRVLGAALLAAAALRLGLRSQDAGMLAVRHRATDVGLLVAVGVALILLAGSIPDQPR